MAGIVRGVINCVFGRVSMPLRIPLDAAAVGVRMLLLVSGVCCQPAVNLLPLLLLLLPLVQVC
jgi:hypothetical protein